MNLRYLEEEKRPFDLMIIYMLCDRRRLPGNNFDKEQIRVQLQLLDANFDVVTVDPIWSDGYISRERVLSVTQPRAAITDVASGRTSPVHSHHSCNEYYIEEMVQCATTSQKLLTHDDAAETSELSDVAARA